jgi:hypothetical protein
MESPPKKQKTVIVVDDDEPVEIVDLSVAPVAAPPVAPATVPISTVVLPTPRALPVIAATPINSVTPTNVPSYRDYVRTLCPRFPGNVSINTPSNSWRVDGEDFSCLEKIIILIFSNPSNAAYRHQLSAKYSHVINRFYSVFKHYSQNALVNVFCNWRMELQSLHWKVIEPIILSTSNNQRSSLTDFIS